MRYNRRDFLRFSLAGSSMVALTGAIPNFLGRTAAQTPQAQQQGARDTILVVVQLTGGNDGLNTVVPFGNADYNRLRPTLRITNSLRVADGIGLHPSMTGLHGLLQDNALCIVQGVGYPNPDQSHFRSMDIWQAASTDRTLSEGWIGKALRHVPAAASFHLANSNEPAPLALTGARRASPRLLPSTISSNGCKHPAPPTAAGNATFSTAPSDPPPISRACWISCSALPCKPTPPANASRRSAAIISRACRIRKAPWAII